MSGIRFYDSGERKEDTGVPVPESQRRQGQAQGGGSQIPGPPGPPGAPGQRGIQGIPGPPGESIVGPPGQRGAMGEQGLPGADGTVVEPNPSGRLGADLTRLRIDETNYNIKDPNATNVLPNPTGTDGALVTRLSINSVNYNLAAGSGGDGGGGVGPVGPVGPQGPPGADGMDGAPGRDGSQGPPGAPGADGMDGAPGAPGRDGTDGRDGRDGSDASVTATNVIATVSGTATAGHVPTYTNSSTWTWAAPATGGGGGGGTNTQTIIREVVEVGRITQKLGSVDVDVASPTVLVSTGLTIPTTQMMAINVGKDSSSGFDDADLYVFFSSRLKDLTPTTAGSNISVSTAVVLYAAGNRSFFVGKTSANEILITSNRATTDLLPLTLYAFNEVLDEDSRVSADVDTTSRDTFKGTGLQIPNANVLALNPGKKGSTSYLDVSLRLLLRDALLALPPASNGDTSLPANSLNIFTGRSDSYYIGRTSTNEILLAASGATVDLIPLSVYPFDIRLTAAGSQMIRILEHTVYSSSGIDIPDTRLMAVNFGRRTNTSIADGDLHLIETADIRRLTAASIGQTVTPATGEMIIHSTTNQFFLGRTSTNELLITCLAQGNLALPFSVYAVNDLRGPPGMDGMDGADGADGAPGTPGTPGRDGMDGRDGVGTQGPPGVPGKDGSSDVQFLRGITDTERQEDLEFELTKSLVANGPWKGEIVREGRNLYYYLLTGNGQSVLVWDMKSKTRVTDREITLGSSGFYRDICSDDTYLYASYVDGSDLAVRVWQLSDKSRVAARDFTLSELKHNAQQYSIATDGRFILAVGEITSVASGVRFYSFDFEGNRTDAVSHSGSALSHIIVSTAVSGNTFISLHQDNNISYATEYNTADAVPLGSPINLDSTQAGEWSSLSIDQGIFYAYNANNLIHKLFAFKYEEIIGISVQGEGVEFPTGGGSGDSGTSTPVVPPAPAYTETRITITSNQISGVSAPEGATHVNFALTHRATSNGKWFLSLPISVFANQTNRVPQTYFSDSENPRQTSINDADIVAINVTLDKDLNTYSFVGSNSNVTILEAFWNNLGGSQGQKGDQGVPGKDGSGGGLDLDSEITLNRVYMANGSTLHTLDIKTGVATQVGSASGFGIGENFPGGLAFHDGVLYMSADYLASVNLSTGVATKIGSVTNFGVNNARGGKGLTSHNGVLYMVEIVTVALYTLNTTTGVATRVGSDNGFGIGLGRESSINSLASHNGVLYAISFSNILYSLDTTTGVATAIGTGTGARDIQGMVSYNGVLYAANPNTLFTINTTTGVATEVARNGFRANNALANVVTFSGSLRSLLDNLI